MSLCCLHFNIEQLSLSFSKGFIKAISLLNIISHQACCCWELIDQSVVSPNEHYVSCLILSRSFWEITILFCTISLFFFYVWENIFHFFSCLLFFHINLFPQIFNEFFLSWHECSFVIYFLTGVFSCCMVVPSLLLGNSRIVAHV